MDDLEQLHRELDVADAAAAALDLGELLAATPDVLLESHLRTPNVVDRGLVQILRVDELGDAFDERVAEPFVADGGSRLDHRLAFPGRGFALVVSEGGGQRANQRARAAPRPEGGVDAERDTLGGRVGQVGDQVGGLGLGDVGAHLFPMEQQEVDVAGVVQLPSAELAERDDRVAVGARVRETRIGHVADLGDHVLERRAVEVARGDPEHRPSAESAEAGGGPVCRRVVRELLSELILVPGADVRERFRLFGMTDQEVARCGREPEDP